MTIKKNLLAAIVAASCVTSVVTAAPTQLAATAFAQQAASSVDVGTGITTTITGNTLTLAGNGTLDRDKFRNLITEKFGEGSTLTTIKIDPASKINLPANSSYLFSLADSSQATSLTTIDGAQYLNTGAVTTMQGMFAETSVDPDVSTWDTSKVTDFSLMFQNNPVANPNVTAWNVRNATDFSYMFNNAKSARPNTATWIANDVDSIDHMFDGCPTDLILLGGVAKNLGSSDEAAFYTGAETTLVSDYRGFYNNINFTGSNYSIYSGGGPSRSNVEEQGFSGAGYIVSNKIPVTVHLQSGYGFAGQTPGRNFEVRVADEVVDAKDWVEGELSTTAGDSTVPGTYAITLGSLKLKADKAAGHILVPHNAASWEITGIKSDTSLVDFGEVNTTKAAMSSQSLQLCNTSSSEQTVTITAPENFTVSTNSLTLDTAGITSSCTYNSQQISVRPKAGLLNGSYTGDLVIATKGGTPTKVRLHVNAIGKEQDTKVSFAASQEFTAQTEELTTGTLTATATEVPEGAGVKLYKYDNQTESWKPVADATGNQIPVKVSNSEQQYRANVENSQGDILATTDYIVPQGKPMQREVTISGGDTIKKITAVGTKGTLTANLTAAPAVPLSYKWSIKTPDSYSTEQVTTKVPTLDVDLSSEGDYSYSVQVTNELGTVVGESTFAVNATTPPTVVIENQGSQDKFAASQKLQANYYPGKVGPADVTYRWTIDGKSSDKSTDTNLITRDKQAHEVKVEVIANEEVVASATTTVPAREVRTLTKIPVTWEIVADKVVFTPDLNPSVYNIDPAAVTYSWTVGDKHFNGKEFRTVEVDKGSLAADTLVEFKAAADFFEATGSTTYTGEKNNTTPTDNGSGNETPDTDNNGTGTTDNNTDGTTIPSVNNDGEKTGTNSGSSTPGTTFFIALVVILAILGTIGAAINGAANNFGAALGNQAANNLFRR